MKRPATRQVGRTGIFQVVCDRNSSIGRALQLEKLSKNVLETIPDDTGREFSQVFADLERSESGRWDVEVFALSLEQLRGPT